MKYDFTSVPDRRGCGSNKWNGAKNASPEFVPLSVADMEFYPAPQIVNAIKSKGLGFIGRLDSDKINDLLIELVSKTAKRMNGAGFTELNERELENTFESIKALIELEKECFNISFDFFQIAE